MQVFIIGTPFETANALSKRHLNNQINEARIILDALNGAKAWSNHPCVLQYKGHEYWLTAYMKCLCEYRKYRLHIDSLDHLGAARIWDLYAMDLQPIFHKDLYYDQMKRRLYTKDPEHYKQWAHLGESDCNWYFVDGEWRKYVNGKRVE